MHVTWQTRLSEVSRRLSTQKEALAANNEQITLEGQSRCTTARPVGRSTHGCAHGDVAGARLAAQNAELQARADGLSRRLASSEQQLKDEQARSLASLRRWSDTHGQLASSIEGRYDRMTAALSAVRRGHRSDRPESLQSLRASLMKLALF